MRQRSRGVRRALIGAVAIAAIPALGACDTSPGAAALIGGSRISVSTLQHQVDAALADPNVTAALAPSSQFSQALGGSTDGFVRQTLSRLISDRLIETVAAQHGVTVTPAEVAAETSQFEQQAGSLASLQQQAAESVGVTADQLPDLIRITVLQQHLSDALVANLTASPAQLRAEYRKDIDQFDRLDVAQIVVSSRSLANQVLAKARRNPASFGALARKYSQDSQSAASGGEVGLVGRSQVVSLLGAAKSKPGTVQLASSQGEYLILDIKSRQLVPLSKATAQLKSALFSGEATALLQKAITDEAQKLGVHVSPRYGKWDPSTQTVIAVKSAISVAG